MRRHTRFKNEAGAKDVRLILCVLVFVVIGLSAKAQSTVNDRTVIMVLFDGFAPAMLEAVSAPNFDRIKHEGAWSRHLIPAFPTVSMINHTSIATGCWPEHHGIMSNVFDDPIRGHYDEDQDADWLTGCESLWSAAERQGKKAAVYNYTGRWSRTRGELAHFTNPTVPWKDGESDAVILGSALDQLRAQTADRPALIVLYFGFPDEQAHYDGVTTQKTLSAVRRADTVIGQIMAAIDALPAGREASLVIGADHGMTPVGPIINLQRILNRHDIKARSAAAGTDALLYLQPGESLERVISDLGGYGDLFDIYPKGHYPDYAHLGAGARAGDALIVAKPPYWIEGRDRFPPWTAWAGIDHIWPIAFTPIYGGLKASHGYPPQMVDMHGIFFAWGAGIAKGVEIPALNTIDIHPTVMKLMGLEPGQPVDGRAVKAVFNTAP